MHPLARLLQLKEVERAGWKRVGISSPESVADHSWGLCLLTLLLCPKHLDRERALSFAVVHDLAEVLTGDITPHDGVSPAQKHASEHSAMTHLAEGRPDLLTLWNDYEAQTEPEAQFVKQLDRLEMALQASIYADSANTAEFVASASRAIHDPDLQAILESL